MDGHRVTEVDAEDDPPSPTIPPAEPASATGSLEAVIEHESNPVKRFFKLLGPGLITGASDDDPSGIGTYATAGAALGFATLWTAIVTLPLMAAVQFICAKIGMVSGRGLAGVLRCYYPRTVLYPAILGLVIANTINAGTDIAAIGAALNMFLPIPITALVVPIAAIIVALQIWGSYRLIARLFKWLTLTLFAYIGAALLAKPPWGDVVQATFLPKLRFDHQYLTTLVAILGTTISPYLFFWQASEEVEEEVSMGRTRLAERKGATDAELKYEMLDTMIGMFFCEEGTARRRSRDRSSIKIKIAGAWTASPNRLLKDTRLSRDAPPHQAVLGTSEYLAQLNAMYGDLFRSGGDTSDLEIQPESLADVAIAELADTCQTAADDPCGDRRSAITYEQPVR